MNILFLTRETPFPADSGVKMRAWLVLERLARNHQVTLVCYDAAAGALREGPLQEICESVHVVKHEAQLGSFKYLKMFFGLFSPAPFAIKGRHCQDYHRVVKEMFAQQKFDLILCDSVYQAIYLPAGQHKIILNEHNIESTIIKRYISIEKNPFNRCYAFYEWLRMKAFEEKIWKRCSLIFACSQVDKEEIEKRTGRRQVEVVPNGVAVPVLRVSEEKPFDLVYTGLIGWKPNEDAVLFFAKQIYPFIKKFLPQVRFWIVGKGPSPAVKALEKEGTIHVTGAVAHVEPYIEKGGIIVVPLRIGSGTRLKILEAFALKKAVVSTTIGCEGLEVTHGKDILIEDDPQKFAGAVISLLEDGPTRKRLGEAGRKLVEEKYSYEVIGKQIEAIIQKL